MQQLSLFADGFDAFEQARSHLRRLDLARARAAVGRARQGTATSIPNHLPVDTLERALAWLQRHLPEPPTAATAAAALAELPRAVVAGQLDDAAADAAELGLVPFLLPHLPEPPDPPRFLDSDRRLPSPLVRALAGDVQTARREFDDLVAAEPDRADLWFHTADTCWRAQRIDEANAHYVRALLLDPAAIDPRRLAHAGLRTCWHGLAAAHPEPAARAHALLTEAWLAGVLAIVPGNRWFRPGQVERRLEAAAAAGVPALQFALLLYQDRTAPTTVDLLRRERMAELDPAAFARFLERLRAATDPATRTTPGGTMPR